MIPPEGAPEPAGNRILDPFPREVSERLRPGLEVVTLAPGDVVYVPHGPIPHVDFPTTCVVSLVAIMGDGSMYELTTVGREGMVGLLVFLHVPSCRRPYPGRTPGACRALRASPLRSPGTAAFPV
jgi:hypothetical protein